MKNLFSLALLLLFALAAFAQSNTGRLIGTVAGPDGVLPGATVKVTDNQTAKERTVVTNSDGGFIVPQLDPGSYKVDVTVSGFKTYTANNVRIEVGQEYSLKVPLEIGQTQDSVTITAGVDLLNSTNPQLSNTVTPRQIVELPLNGRDPTSLILLQAGTASNGAQGTSINGQRPTFTNITRDGINIQDNHIRSNASSFSVERPNVDDVGEFTLTTQNAGAELGYGASQVQFVTPRGQNAFHGGLQFYNRNSKFSANRYFNNASGTPLAFLNRNQFGGKLSGPIIKNKLFFFGFYEGLRTRTQSTQVRTILTPSARQGIFTYVDNANTVRSVNLFTLLGNAGLPGIDPIVSSRILANVPAVGNAVDRGDQRNTTGYRFNQRSNTDTDKWTGRFDYEINDKHTINGVMSYTNERVNDRPDVDSPSGYQAIPVFAQPSTRQFAAVAWRWTPSATFTNEVRGGAFLSDPFFIRTQAEPAFYLTLPLINNPEVNTQEQGRDTGSYNIQNNAEKQWGKHALRFGGQSQFVTDFTSAKFDTVPRFTLGTNPNTPAFVAGQFTGGISNAQLGTANNLLALLGGIVGTGTQTFNAATRISGYSPGAAAAFNYAFDIHSLYLSDQWRATPGLTLTLGLRYELYTPLREKQGLALEPFIPAGQTVQQAVLDPNGKVDFINGYGNNKLHKTDKNNFAPVLGFAYSPNFQNSLLSSLFGSSGKTVIRGGFRMSYVNDEILRSQDSSQQTNAGLSTGVTLANLNARLGSVPTINAPTFALPRTFLQNNQIAANFGAVFAIDPNYQIARSNEYSLGIQRELGWQTALEIRYVGGRSNNLPRGLDINNFDMTSNGFLADFNRARANLLLTNNAGCTTTQNPGCQALTVFPRFAGGGLLTNATVANTIRNGEPQSLLLLYVQNGLQGTVPLRPNENAGTVSILENGGMYNYNSLQVELRKRFSNSLYFQTNYTFQKVLTNATGTDQFKFNTNLDNSRPELEYSRADYDQTHVFNFNGIYELPFGAGKRWLNQSGWINRAFGGFQLTSILNLATGAPVTFVDVRGTLNRVSRSARQTPQTNLSKNQVKDLIGIHKTPCGVYFINPSVINLNQSTCAGTGRAAEGLGSTPFAGQVFFNNGAGQTGMLERAFVNGPLFVGWDASIIKNIQMTETSRLQLRLEAFNVMNRANFSLTGAAQSGAGALFDINSATFGRFSGTFAPRVVQLVGRFEF